MAVPANKIRIAAAMGSKGFPLLPIFGRLVILRKAGDL